MRTRIYHLWETLTSSFWFVPAIMLLGAVVLALGLLAIDRARIGDGPAVWWLYSGGSDGAWSLLSALAGSIITVAGVVFSITISTLTLASSQFGPRLLRNFIRDTGNQVVLGTFVATFLYCLLILRSVRGTDGVQFVPHLSVTVAVLLAAADIGMLVYFIDHVARSLQAPNVVAAVGRELEHAIEHMFPEGLGQGHPAGQEAAPPLPQDFQERARPVPADRSAYIQAIDQDRLMRLAREHDLIVRLDQRPGAFVIRGSAWAHVWPPQRCDGDLVKELNATLLTGPQRTEEQDVEHVINQIVELAVRALSPGINDPFTAMTCTDWLGAALGRLANHRLPGGCRYDDAGHLRIIAHVSTFRGLTDAALNQIRQYGRKSAAVMIHLLEVIADVAQQARDDEQRAALLHHVQLIYEDAGHSIPQERDREDMQQRYRQACKALAASDGHSGPTG